MLRDLEKPFACGFSSEVHRCSATGLGMRFYTPSTFEPFFAVLLKRFYRTSTYSV